MKKTGIVLLLLLLAFVAGLIAGSQYQKRHRTIEMVSLGPFKKAVPLFHPNDTVEWYKASNLSTPLTVTFPFVAPCPDSADKPIKSCTIDLKDNEQPKRYKYDCDGGTCSDPDFPVGGRYGHLERVFETPSASPQTNIAMYCKSNTVAVQTLTVHQLDSFSWEIQGDNPDSPTPWTVTFNAPPPPIPCQRSTFASTDPNPVCTVLAGTAATSYSYTAHIDKCQQDGTGTLNVQ